MGRLYSPKDIVSSGLCIGCGICIAQSPTRNTRIKFDKYGQLKPFGSADWYNQPQEDFSSVCPFSPKAKNENELAETHYPQAPQQNISIGRYEANYVGYVQEKDFRTEGSSGGMVSWVAAELMRRKLIDGVAHVIPTQNPQAEGRFFKYRISRNEEEICQGAKSRYYPVELSEVLETIRKIPGKYTVVAIPCMIKAIHLLRHREPIFRERICYTLGLFCGHMKSARFVESFAWQMNVPFKEVQEVEFRYKYPERPANWYNTRLKLTDGQTYNKDWWHLRDGDWGAGFFMNSACNYCDDVVAETAHISFGDAWVEPYSSDGMGTNVIIVRSKQIKEIIDKGIAENTLSLKEVDAAFVEQTQAAGLRQRREGLSYRLTWHKRGITPIKRVLPATPPKNRKIIYQLRFIISKWSHRMFWLARKSRFSGIYLLWARIFLSIYYGIAYHRGNVSQILNRFKELKN